MLADCLAIMTRLMKDGKTLEQLQAAKPFAKYHEKWRKGFMKAEQWIALNYQGMSKT